MIARFVSLFLVSAVAVAALPSAAVAQCPSGPSVASPKTSGRVVPMGGGGGGECGSVSVTPDGAAAPARLPNTGGYTANFTVQNTGGFTDGFFISCSGVWPIVVCNNVTPGYVTLSPGQSAPVTATYSVGPAGQGSLSVGASAEVHGGYDDGWYVVPVTATLDLTQNPGDRLERTGCVIGSAGPSGAFYCGELLVTQATVGYRSMNEVRSPTLVYGSRAANGFAEVTADVTPSSGSAQPDRVIVRVGFPGTTHVDSVYYAGWTPGATRRLVVPIAGGLASGLYDATVDVMLVRGSTTETVSSALAVVIVNRGTSPFGSGWWLAGISRAYTHASQMAVAFVEAEGSAVVFRKQGDGVWRAPQGETSTLSVSGPDYVRRLQNQTVLRYSVSTGRLSSVRDTVGNQATFSWGSNPPGVDGYRLDAITDEAGRQVQFWYSAAGRLDSIGVPGAQRTRVFTGAAGDVDSIRDPDGLKTSFLYAHGQHRMSQRTGRRLGETSSFYFVASNTSTALLDYLQTPDGTLNHRAYQEEGLPASGTGTPSSLATPGTRDSARVRILDYRGYATRISVDRLGRPTRAESPDGGVVTIARHAGTSLPTSADWTPLGRHVTLVWDTLTSELQSFSDGSGLTRYAYHPVFHGITRVISPTSDTTLYEYGTRGLLDRTIGSFRGSSRDTTRFAFNSRGQVRQIYQFGHSQPTEFQYDSTAGYWNLLWAQSPQQHLLGGSPKTQYAYNANKSDIDAVVAGDNARVEYTYDAIKRPIIVRNYGPTGYLVRSDTVVYSTDERTVRRAIPVADGYKNATVSLDALGRVVSRCLPALIDNCHRYYYSSGLLDSMWVAAATDNTKLNRRSWTYDSMGRVQQFSFTAPALQVEHSAHAAYVDTSRFAYNQLGAITRAENGRSIVRRGYWSDGRLVCEHQLIRRWDNLSANPSTAHQNGITYYYDAAGRVTWAIRARSNFDSLSSGASACAFWAGAPVDTTRYHFDSRARLDSIISLGLGVRFQVQYDAASRRQLLTNSYNTWQETWSYDQDDLPFVHEWHRLSPSQWVSRDTFLIRDAVGRVTREWRNPAGYANFTYDGLGQVVKAASESLAYDAVGSGTLKWTYDNTTANVQQHVYDLNGFGRLQSLDVTNYPGRSDHFYSYDRAGNRSRDSVPSAAPAFFMHVDSLDYDGAGRLVAIRLDSAQFDGQTWRRGSHLTTYWYDALGRRILVADSLPNGQGKIRRFFFDGDNVVVSGEHPIGIAGQSTDDYPLYSGGGLSASWLNDIGVNRPLAMRPYSSGQMPCGASNTRYFFHADERGSIRSTTYEAGDACQSTGYQAFGSQTSSGTFNTSVPGYTGAQTDISGLVFLRNRYYDPNTGTFTQPDPIGMLGGINLYGYVGNDPVGLTDPYGLCPPRDINVNDCGLDLIGRAYRVLAAHGGEQTIDAIVARGIAVSTRSGGSIVQAQGKPTIAYNDGASRVFIAEGVNPGAAAALIRHEVTHIVAPGANVCQGEVTAANAGLDTYDALPAGRDNRVLNDRSAQRAANPARFNAEVYAETRSAFRASDRMRDKAAASACNP